MSVNSKLTALADEIRVLSGTTYTMGLDAMKAHVDEANDEIASQVELLTQVVAALEGKASGSGGIETCEVTVIVDGVWEELQAPDIYLEYTDGDQKYVYARKEFILAGSIYSLQIAKNSLFMIGPGWRVTGVEGVNYESHVDDLTNSMGEKYNLFRITGNATIHVTC